MAGNYQRPTTKSIVLFVFHVETLLQKAPTTAPNHAVVQTLSPIVHMSSSPKERRAQSAARTPWLRKTLSAMLEAGLRRQQAKSTTPMLHVFLRVLHSRPNSGKLEGPMEFNRRDLLAASLALGASPLLAPLAHACTEELAAAQDQEVDRSTLDFWTSQVRRPSQEFAETGRLPSAPTGSHFAAQNPDAAQSTAEYLYYSQDTGFVRATDTTANNPLFGQLLDKGDAAVLFSVDTIRPSDPHMKILLEAKNGSVRIDMKQAKPLPDLFETLNWSAIASLFPNSEYSGYHDLQFDPKTTWGPNKKVPLPQGIGFWSWNFCTQPKPSFWMQAMGLLFTQMKGKGSSVGSAIKSSIGSNATGIGKLVLGLGFPAIASTALDALDNIFASMISTKKTEWILRNADTPLIATKDARQSNPGRAVALRSGSYVIVPEAKADAILSGKYELMNGYLVPPNTDPNQLSDAAKNTLKDTSYIALSTMVQTTAI